MKLPAALLGATATLALSAAPAPDEVAASIFRVLPGKWSFTLGQRSGTRVVTELYSGKAVSWSETFNDRGTRADGITGWDPIKKRVYSFSTHNVPGAYGLGESILHDDGRGFTSVPRDPDPGKARTRTVFRLLGPDEFTYTAEREEPPGWQTVWIARFTRAGG